MVLEGYHWTAPAFAGAALCLSGNLLILKKRATVPAPSG
jgi:hypothetical protein